MAGATQPETLRIVRHGLLRGAKRLIARVKVDNFNGNVTATRLRLDR